MAHCLLAWLTTCSPVRLSAKGAEWYCSYASVDCSAPEYREEEPLALAPMRVMPPSDTSPLTLANAVGRGVMLPRYLWPQDSCFENGGAGWDAYVVRVVPKTASAVVAFIAATDADGRPFEDTTLKLSLLLPK